MWTILGDKNSIQMDNFVPQTHRHTHTHTDTLIFFISTDKPIGASPRRWLDSSCCVGLLGLLCCDHDDRVFPYNGYGNSMSSYLCKKSLRKPKMIILFMDVYKVGFTVGGFGL